MAEQIRRIVTGHTARGRSTILSDTVFALGSAPGASPRVGLWLTDQAPASNTKPDPVPTGVIEKTSPLHRGGNVFRIVEFPPEQDSLPVAADLARRGAEVDPQRSARHPGFHRTQTVDYALCLKGEMWAILDETETLMKPGDVLIQRGTYHAWANRSIQPAVMAFILIDAEPIK